MTDSRYVSRKLLPNGYHDFWCVIAHLHAMAVPNRIHISVAPCLLLSLLFGSPSVPLYPSPNLTPSIILLVSFSREKLLFLPGSPHYEEKPGYTEILRYQRMSCSKFTGAPPLSSYVRFQAHFKDTI